jgi:hypothetical protein
MTTLPATVRLFGGLHTLQRERGRETVLIVDVPDQGMTGFELARVLELPLESIEGIFCNHTVRPLGYVVFPGDQVAFVPQGTPGPHRFFLGLYKAGKEAEELSHKTDTDSDERY